MTIEAEAAAIEPAGNPRQKTTELNCSKTIVFEVILQFTIVNYSITTRPFSPRRRALFHKKR